MITLKHMHMYKQLHRSEKKKYKIHLVIYSQDSQSWNTLAMDRSILENYLMFALNYNNICGLKFPSEHR